jgi:hypothetical protein
VADYDDDRPDFDAAFADDPDNDPPKRRRGFSRRRRGAEDVGDVEDTASTGEVPRSGLRGFASSTPPSEDDDFDHLEEEPGAEPPPPPRSASASRRGGGRGGRPPRRPPRGGSRGAGGGASVLQRPRGRLILAIAFAAILILVITLVVRDCQRNQLEDQYTSYLNGVAKLVNDSAQQGQQLRQVLANPRGEQPPKLRQKIQALSQQAGGLVDQAETLDPPGALGDAQRSFVTALEYRVTGLSTLAANLPTILQRNDVDFQANSIAGSMQRFLASDVIYQDSFAGPAALALEKDDFTGTPVPKAQPFLPNPALATNEGARTLLPNLKRRTAQSASGGNASSTLRGTSLVSTEALPSETRLTPGSPTSVQGGGDLKWRVTVENGGDFDESNIVVTATLSYPDTPNEPDSKEASIESLALGESTTVEIPGPTTPVFGEQGTLRIEIQPVSGESSTDNNAAEYPVKITI